MFRSTLVAACLFAFSSGSALAAPPRDDTAFFRSVQGSWAGAGEIIAGKYAGTKFNCRLDGAESEGRTVMAIGGMCRVGIFSQKMEARIDWAKSGYRGAFLDGAAGKGLDVVGGQVGGGRAVFSLERQQLNGAMIARMTSRDSMTVTISVLVGDSMVPVIGLGLNRTDPVQTGSIR